MRRITKAALGGIVGCALVLVGTQVAVGAFEGTYKFSRDRLVDPLPFMNDGAFASAKAGTTITQTTGGTTTFAIRVTGIDRSVQGQEFAAHLHVGPCNNSGGHYQHVVPGPADAKNEVWFALVPNEDGMAFSRTTAGFVPDDAKYPTNTPGVMSIVIHKGTISAPGPKQACFPLSVPQWDPEPSPSTG